MSAETALSGNFLQAFWDLASEEEAERIRAASHLVTYLSEQQSNQKEGPCYEVGYALERLVKGMASHRKMARSGYFITLTEVLRFPSATLSHVMSLLNKHLEIGKGKSQEERGAFFGRVFVLLALIEAGKAVTEDEVTEVLRGLQACCKKTYLQEFCAVATCKLVTSCEEDLVRTRLVQLLGLEGEGGGWDTCSPHCLYILLSLNQVWGKTKWWRKLMKTNWNRFLKAENYPRMATILAESSSSHPRIHCVWPLMMGAIREKGHLTPFWKIVVDDCLMTSSHDRKFLGFKLLESILPTLECAEVSAVFSTNLLQCWMNNVSSGGNYLHAAAKHLLTVLMSYLQSAHPAITASILLHLQSSAGNRFEQLIGTKAVVSVLSKMDLVGITKYLDKLKELFCDPVSVVDTEQRSAGPQMAYSFSVQLWAADQILNLVRNRRLQRVEPWLLRATHFLFVHSFFDLSKPHATTSEVSGVLKTPLSKATQDGCVQKFDSALAELCAFVSTTKTDGVVKFTKPGTMEAGGYYASAIMRFAMDLVSQGVEMAEPFSEVDREAWELATSEVVSLTEKESNDLVSKAFLLLFSVLGIRLFSDRSRCRQSIQELKVCYDEMLITRTKTPKKKSKEQHQATPGWMDVLIDMLLGFLSEGSQLWRSVVDQVFRMVATHITPSALELIVKVLEPQTKEDLMKDGEEEEEGTGEEEEGSGEEEEGSGEEEEKAAVKRPKSRNDKNTEEDDDSMVHSGEEEEVEETEGATIDPAFRADIKKALGAAAATSSDDEQDEPLDDEAMMAVDGALAEAFKLHMKQRSQKKTKKEEEVSVVHFKLRVLDLVDVYLKREYSNPLILDLVVPLYQLVHQLQAKKDFASFACKATSVYKTKLCGVQKYPKVGIDCDRVHSHLHTLIELLDKATPTTSSLATLGCMFLLKVLRGATVPPAVSPLTTRSGKKRKRDGDSTTPAPIGMVNVAMVTEWFAEALRNFATKKSSPIPPAFFTTYIDRFPVLSWHLVPHMVKVIDEAVNQFKKAQIYEMLHHQLSQTTGDKDVLAHMHALVPDLTAHCIKQLSSSEEEAVSGRKVKPLLAMLTKLMLVSSELEVPLDAEGIRNAVEKAMNREGGGGGGEDEYSNVLAALSSRGTDTREVVVMSTKKRTKT